MFLDPTLLKTPFSLIHTRATVLGGVPDLGRMVTRMVAGLLPLILAAPAI
jgi:hypothetical protein